MGRSCGRTRATASWRRWSGGGRGWRRRTRWRRSRPSARGRRGGRSAREGEGVARAEAGADDERVVGGGAVAVGDDRAVDALRDGVGSVLIADRPLDDRAEPGEAEQASLGVGALEGA